MSRTDPAADGPLSNAMDLHRAGRLEEAEKAYRRLLRRRAKDHRLLYLLGMTVHQRGRPAAAARLLADAVRRHPDAPEYHRFLGLALKDDGRLEEAEAAYRAALARAPEDAALHANLGACLRAQGKPAEAADSYRAAVARAPTHAGLRNNLGLCLREAGQLEDAEAELAEAVRLWPDHAGARANRADALWRLGDAAAAAEEARAALAADPALPQAHYTLGNALKDVGAPEAALAAFSQAVDLAPDFAEARTGLAAAALAKGDAADAADACRAALADAPHLEEAHTVMGQALYALHARGDEEEAARRAAEWLETHGDAPVARHMAPPLMDGGATTQAPERAEDGFVRANFDAFAATFDDKLARLDYRGPAVIAELLAREPTGLRALDLGCGTGLCAEPLRSHAARLEGVDLSPEMLARAAPLYDAVHEAEAAAHLRSLPPGAVDVAAAADMLIYVGALEYLAAAVAAALSPGGCFVFTAETHAADADWLLRPQGRYAHRPAYLRRVLEDAGLMVETLHPVSLRQEAGADVPAVAGRARKPAR